MSTRGQRHLANLRTELIHERQRNALAGAHRSLDRLEAEQDRLAAMGWNRTPAQSRRLGTVTTVIADTRQRIAELQAIQAVERDFKLEPTLPPVEVSGSRFGMPPTWYIDGPPAPTRSRAGSATQPASRPATAATTPSARGRGQRRRAARSS
jgi:hypothetical protein